MVVNLAIGEVLNIPAGAITGTAHVYRTGQGYANPGQVAWEEVGQPPVFVDIAVGETVSFQINGNAGRIANGCPSMIQVLY